MFQRGAPACRVGLRRFGAPAPVEVFLVLIPGSNFVGTPISPPPLTSYPIGPAFAAAVETRQRCF
jgi:hypothetical protein